MSKCLSCRVSEGKETCLICRGNSVVCESCNILACNFCIHCERQFFCLASRISMEVKFPVTRHLKKVIRSEVLLEINT